MTRPVWRVLATNADESIEEHYFIRGYASRRAKDLISSGNFQYVSCIQISVYEGDYILDYDSGRATEVKA